MDEYILGMRLILLVVALLLRINGFITIYMRRKRIWILPPLILNLFSPLLCIMTLSYVTSKSWTGVGKGKTLGDAVLFIFLLIGSQVFAGMILMGGLFILGLDLPSGRGIGPAADPVNFLPVYLLALLALSALLLLCMLRIVMPEIETYALLKGKKVIETAAMVYLLLVPLELFIWGYGWVLGDAGFEVSSNPFMFIDGAWEIAAVFISIVIIAPFIEEIFFRGYLFKLFEWKLGNYQAIMLTAILFAAIHFNIHSFLPILIMGMIMGWARSRSGSIVPSLVLHMSNNLMALLLVVLA